MDRSPMDRMRVPRARQGVPRPAPLEVFHAILAGPEPWRTAVALAGYAGLRMGEIIRARREDVTAEHLIVLRKGGKEVALPNHPQLWEIAHLYGTQLLRQSGNLRVVQRLMRHP